MMGSGIRRVAIWGFALAMLAGPARLCARNEPTIDELKAQISHADVRDRPPLCLKVSERQLQAADKFYASGDSEAAKGALTDVVAFAEQAGNYSIQSHKHEKQSEIALRKVTRKLADLKHAVSVEDQQQVQSAIDRLQKIRDDLLQAMFSKGGKK
jgi:hypothetical protein